MRASTPVLFCLLGCSCCAQPVVVIEGTCGTYSPDGSKIAFQRAFANRSRVGVMSVADGRVAWVEKEGSSAHPAWNRNGDAIVYTYGNETNTAFAARNGTSGYHLRIWRRGAGTREVTSGRFRDSMPSFSPDGEALFFASTRCTETSGVVQDTRTGLYSLSLADGALTCRFASPTPNSGVGQPVHSPDGRFVAFARIDRLASPWKIVCARADDWNSTCVVTPETQHAYAPRWSPCGRYLLYTGFQKGDPGWCVYALDTRSGATRRICRGMNPDVHPSGKLLLFDDGRRLIERPLAAADLPDGSDATSAIPEMNEPERVIWGVKGPECPQTLPMGPDFAFGDDRTFFLRVKFRYEPAAEPRFRYFLSGDYSDPPPGPSYTMGFEFLLDRGTPQFGTRDASGLYGGVDWAERLEPGRTYALTGIRAGSRLYISIDGKPPVARRMPSFIPLAKPDKIALGHSYSVENGILSAEIGTGWPRNVPSPLACGTFFADGKEARK